MKKISKKFSFRSSVTTFLKVVTYLKKYRAYFVISLVLTALSVALSLYVPILIGNAIDLAISENNVNISAICTILFRIGICILVTAIFQWFINVLNNKMVYGIVKNVRYEAFEKIQKLPLSFIDSHHSGDVISRIITDSDQFSDGLLMGFSQFFNGIMTILGTIIFMFLISPPVTLIVIFVTPISLFVAAFIARL